MSSGSGKPKVLYMLGAGASAKALPMVSQIAGRLAEHIELLASTMLQVQFTAHFTTEPRLSFQQVLDQYLADVRKLREMAAVHESIDTYAKKLFLKGKPFHEELFRLKVALSMFMAYEQAKRAEHERRYDGFFASILSEEDGLLRIPEDVLILNWNYDQMLGHAFKEYTQSGQFHECHAQLRVFPLHEVNSNEPCSVVHLNGMFAYQEKDHQFHPIITTKRGEDLEIISDMLRYYYRAHHKEGDPLFRRMDAHLMRFAWEGNQQHRRAFASVLNRLLEVKALVIIGYSFPFFNREFDRQILHWLGSLERIYIQAPDGAAQDIGRTIKASGISKEVQIEYYTNTDKFLLPREL